MVKVNEDAIIPIFAHPTDSGFDLFTCEDITVSGGKKGIAKTGLIFEIPQGWGIQIKNKSGITIKGVPTTSGNNADITVFEGTVDMDYRGELGIMFKNEDILEIVKFIKQLIHKRYNFIPKVLYGGSINDENIMHLNNIQNIDGYLVGGACLDTEKFKKIIETVR